MSLPRQLQPVAHQTGRPLYLSVKAAIREAIDAGAFSPGQQMPSTKDLSDQLRVSLVTAHRALQELVSAGVLRRAQGRGTFVHDRYGERTPTEFRLGLVLDDSISLADFYHSEILEGVRQACNERSMDLVHLRLAEDLRSECSGLLYFNPPAHDPQPARPGTMKRQPAVALVVGAQSPLKHVASYDPDNANVARLAVQHLAGLGHRYIGYVAGSDRLGSSRDRWQGFLEGCREAGCEPDEQHVLSIPAWRPGEAEQIALQRMLLGARRPTAIVAAGYPFALAVYAAAASAGVRIPSDLSVVGVDDPESARFLSPPLTTLRQPLHELGRAAVVALLEHMRPGAGPPQGKLIRGELVERGSTGAPPAAARQTA